MARAQVYDERLFSLIARRANLVERVFGDGVVVDSVGLNNSSKMISRRVERQPNLLSELVDEMAENMPELAINYGLVEHLSDGHMRSGASLVEAIRLARIARGNDFSYSGVTGFDSVFRNYLNNLSDDNKMSSLACERAVWSEGLRGAVQSAVFDFYDVASNVFSGSEAIVDPVYSSSSFPMSLTKLATNAGKLFIPSHRVRGLNLSLLENMLFPEPEYDFAGPEDSWSLFRSTYLDRAVNSFGLIDLRAELGSPLYVVNHGSTNALGKIRQLNEGLSSPTLIATNPFEAIQRFDDIVLADDDLSCLAVYSVSASDYAMNKVDWYNFLLREFGRVSTIRSVSGDDSLNLRRYEYSCDDDFLLQNLNVESVNLGLRKVVSMGRVLGGYDISLRDSYALTKPIIGNYRREAFEANIGTLVSDISSIPEAHGWMFLPTYLDPSRYPSIGVSSESDLSSEARVNIAVRSFDVLSLMGVRRSVYSTFGDAQDVYSS